MPPAIYRTGMVIAHLCLNVIAFLCLVTLLLMGGSRSNAWLNAEDLTRKLTSLINEEVSSPARFLRGLGGDKIVEEPGQLPTYSTGRRHFYVKDWKLVELNWVVSLKQSILQLDSSVVFYDMMFTHTEEQFTPWQAVQRLNPYGNLFRSTISTTGSSFVSFPTEK